jgi:hypothetical protein
MRTTAFSFCAAILATACGADPAPPAAAPKPRAVTAAPKPASLPPGHLARADVDSVLARGPAWVFQRVKIEEVLRENKFIGWRVTELPESWKHIDLKTGDVVTRVNGMTLERPEEVYTAWSSLNVASELKVSYERDGAAREVVFTIDGEPGRPTQTVGQAQGAAAEPPAERPAPPPERGKPRSKKTVVIVEDDSIAGDDGD